MEKCKEFVDSCKKGTRTVMNAMEKTGEKFGKEWRMALAYALHDSEESSRRWSRQLVSSILDDASQLLKKSDRRNWHTGRDIPYILRRCWMCRANDWSLNNHSLVDAQPWCEPGESEQESEELHNCKAGGNINRVVELWWRGNDRLLDGALAESVEENG